MRIVLFIAGLLATHGFAATPSPVVLELFTSQGCSSCPPAEALLSELAAKPNVIALAYHVDYWDYNGWRDRFGLRASSQRQERYARKLGLKTVFTPQLIIGGEHSLVGSDRNAIYKAIDTARDGLPIAANLAGNDLEVHLDANADGSPYEVTLVAYLPQAETAIAKGENAGRTVKETNVVRTMRKLGTWKGKPAKYTVPLSSLPKEATQVAILIQKPNGGRIAGATVASVR